VPAHGARRAARGAPISQLPGRPAPTQPRATPPQTPAEAARLQVPKKIVPQLSAKTHLAGPIVGEKTAGSQGFPSIAETGFEPAIDRPPARCAMQCDTQRATWRRPSRSKAVLFRRLDLGGSRLGDCGAGRAGRQFFVSELTTGDQHAKGRGDDVAIHATGRRDLAQCSPWPIDNNIERPPCWRRAARACAASSRQSARWPADGGSRSVNPLHDSGHLSGRHGLRRDRGDRTTTCRTLPRRRPRPPTLPHLHRSAERSSRRPSRHRDQAPPIDDCAVAAPIFTRTPRWAYSMASERASNRRPGRWSAPLR
jgi:hypothetical protein